MCQRTRQRDGSLLSHPCSSALQMVVKGDLMLEKHISDLIYFQKFF